MPQSKHLPPDYEGLAAISMGDCTQLTAEQVESYDSTEHDMVYRSFRRHFTRGEWLALQEQFSYEISSKAGLTMEQDWHVRYGWGYLDGKKVICLHHSCIHYFFQSLTEQHGEGVYSPRKKVNSCRPKNMTSKSLSLQGSTKIKNMRATTKPARTQSLQR